MPSSIQINHIRYRVDLFFEFGPGAKLSYIERSGEKGILVSLDKEKAFNRVNRPFLLKFLTHL